MVGLFVDGEEDFCMFLREDCALLEAVKQVRGDDDQNHPSVKLRSHPSARWRAADWRQMRASEHRRAAGCGEDGKSEGRIMVKWAAV